MKFSQRITTQLAVACLIAVGMIGLVGLKSTLGQACTSVLGPGAGVAGQPTPPSADANGFFFSYNTTITYDCSSGTVSGCNVCDTGTLKSLSGGATQTSNTISSTSTLVSCGSTGNTLTTIPNGRAWPSARPTW